MATPATWSSRFVFTLAAIGAAVGLGNIWRFPYLAGSSGGSAFVLVYLGAVCLVAVPVLIAEMLLGRRGRGHPAAAFAAVAASRAHFDGLLADPWAMMGWSGAYTALAIGIVARGLHAGIERSITLLMPLLFASLLALVGYAAAVGDLAAGLDYLFRPDFSRIDGGVVLAAVGQAFFSIGVGMGIMMTYGAYLPREVSLTRSAFLIGGSDTLVAVLAGVALFPLVFENGLDPGQGPGLVFVTLPIAFGNMPAGAAFGGVFFVLLVVAALTSSIAVIEPMVLWLMDRFRWRRSRAAWTAGVTAWIAGLGTVLSFNAWKDWFPLGGVARFAGKTFFELLDYATSSVLMPLCALLVALFVGWRMNPEHAAEELGLGRGFHFAVWRGVLLRWVVPAAIAGILLAGL